MKFLPFKIAIILILLLSLCGCKQKNQTIETDHSPFNECIAAFSSGFIPTTGSFFVEFTDSVPGSVPGQKVSSSLVTIEPSLKGNWLWTDHKTIKFTPSVRLSTGQKWKITLHLKKLFKGEDDFFFEIATIPQNYRVTLNSIQPAEQNDYKAYKITGRLQVADDITPEEASSMVSASIEDKTIAIEWQSPDGKTHLFEITPINRTTETQQLTITHTGDPINANGNGTEIIQIPALGDFTIQSTTIIQQPSQLIRVTFSEPLDATQNLDGLISLSNGQSINYSVNQNILEIYPTAATYGDTELVLLSGIRSMAGATLKEGAFRSQISFTSLKPAVDFVGKGNILPSSENPIIHFKAVSLKSVVLRVIKIYESNVPYFLQINTMDESSQLKRAGRLIHQQLIHLNEDATLNLNQWNTFAIDLSTMIQPDPGAIYRVELGFERGSSVYPCDDTDDAIEEMPMMPNDDDFWDSADNYYSDYPYNYTYWDWEERDNPCSNAYYQRERYVTRNLLASNLGIIAKAGSNNQTETFVTNLQSTRPVADAMVTILNFQMQPIGSGTTDKEGKCVVTTSGQPFLLIVKKDNQRGYLRVDDGQSLSLSKFDVSGQTIKQGIKGFIYGDRGVWRPGDSLYISFMPEDKLHKLPANYPVTFELLNPQGQLVQRAISRHPQNKLYTFKTVTAPEAPTGFWQIRALMGDLVFTKNLRIETIKPNRLRIQLEMDKLLTSGNATTIKLFSEWLHGASAGGLKAQVEMTLNPVTTTFDAYPNYHFDDQTRDFEPSREVVFEAPLDNEGKAAFLFHPNIHQRSPGFVRVNFTTRVFEQGGSFSIGTDQNLYSPYNRYIGIRAPQGDHNGYLMTDTDHHIDVVTVNEQGKSVSLKGLTYTIYKINWRWWWDRSEEKLGRYVSSQSANIIKQGNLTTINGKASIPFRIDQPEWGRYLIRVEDPVGGHAATTTVLVDWPGWAQKTNGVDAEAASMLIFNTDKEKYNVGDVATVTFPSAGKGRALVSLENGTKVLRSWWVEPKPESTSFTFKVTEDMTPNIYIHISLLQPQDGKDNDLPVRMYGILPITVFSPASQLTPQIKTSKEWRPNQKVTIKVSEAGNQAMTYTLAIVDEGLLDLTRFQTPDPWNHFNAREALGVKTWDMYDYVLGAYGGQIERLFSIGGDADMLNSEVQNNARRFDPMVHFYGPFDLKKGRINEHTLQIPNYTGSVRAMVVATNGSATGSTENTITIRQPLMVWAALPRVLGPGETVALPVTVFVSDKSINKVDIEIKTDKNVISKGLSKQTIQFDKIGEQTLFFELQAGEITGPSTIEVKAVSGKETATHTVHLPIRNPNPSVTKVKSEVIAAGKTTRINYNMPGVQGTNKTTLELSILTPINFGKRLEYLLSYPHGCIEQITSKAFPQLYLSDLSDLSPEQMSRAMANVQETLGKMGNYQTGNGGFAYWPGGPTADEWATSYAGHFMIEAELKGYALPATVKKQWLKYQKSQVNAWMPDKSGRYYGHDFIQAYRLYTLALAGETHLSGMNRMRQQPNLSQQAKWRLAAAYAIAGMNDVAQELTQTIAEIPEQTSVFSNTYGSKERDMAMTLETMLLMKDKEKAARLARELTNLINRDHWLSTQTTAYSLLALSKYISDNNKQTTKAKVKYSFNNDPGTVISFTKPINQQKPKTDLPVQGSLSVTNQSDGEVFANLIMSGQPLRDTLTQKVEENLAIKVDYATLNGIVINPSTMVQGTDFKVTVSLKNTGAKTVNNLALTQIFPSGWEIRNSRMEGNGSLYEIDQPDYRDIRDDRVYSYLSLMPGETKRLVIGLHASYVGRFYLPAVSCEAMYDYSIRASQPGMWINVTKQ
jgi:uncharacterized protein YfaS (alpha-2-macroglobulin family)